MGEVPTVYSPIRTPGSVGVGTANGRFLLPDKNVTKRQRLDQDKWVYLWADCIYSGLRAEDMKLCALVIVGVNKHGEKHFLAIEDGIRESAQSWREYAEKNWHRLRGFIQLPKVVTGVNFKDGIKKTESNQTIAL